ncbi:hypothetical protein C0992_012698 [Termitomyces sp. T32_za158]|nr:hypothetical protein C0992_012698 [Termitomyces sp. T32_za158]
MASAGLQDVEMAATPVDAASSLRELALKSIKSRRKPLSESFLPLRPPPPEAAFQLDYGQEDVSPSCDAPHAAAAPAAEPPAPMSPVVVPASAPKPPSLSITRPTPVPDNQAREEGEISDEDEAQAAPQPPNPPSPLPLPASTLQVPRGSRHSTPSAATPVSLDTRPPLFERLSDHPFASSSQALTRSEEPTAVRTDPVPVLPASSHSLDTDHIRPGVALNQDQYDKAKDIVLDLLGWGVDPEYLVDCGVTREVVYYVFTELNLRLPKNLDTIGLAPFTPEDALELQKSAMMPPPPPPARSKLLPQDLPSVSTNVVVHTPSPPPAVSPARTSSAIESPRPISTSDLHDMEQQRRQELMARKAAIASKKLKNVPPATSVPPSTSTESEDMNIDSVEDFLKTIGSSSATSHSNGATPHQSNDDDMDIDEIPGLSGASAYKASASASSSSASRTPLSSSTLISPTESTYTLLSPNEPPPSSTESSTTQSTETSTSSLTETQLSEGPALQRRVFRRPVASDFVDFDEGRPPSHNSRNGYRHANGGQRRRPTGFASVISQPRCIIDVSDSEGEGDGDVVMRDMQTAWRSGYASPAPTKPFLAHLNTNGWATPPVSTPTPTPGIATPTGTMTPAVLLEKENEIQRMREIIAQKERRLKEAKALESSAKAEVKQEETPVALPPESGSSQVATCTGAARMPA